MTKMKAVYLCGFMGCGKSTIGRILAQKCGCALVDMDDYIVEREGMTIPQIFADKGEKYFRDTETAVIGELAEKNCIIACGGGAMLKKENYSRYIGNSNILLVCLISISILKS